jgi:Arc/MetJ family transcription regulator
LCIENFIKMRTNIDIDDKLIEEAMKLSSEKNKKGMVNLALTEFIKLQKRQKFKELFGKVKWEGNLKDMRSI